MALSGQTVPGLSPVAEGRGAPAPDLVFKLVAP